MRGRLSVHKPFCALIPTYISPPARPIGRTKHTREGYTPGTEKLVSGYTQDTDPMHTCEQPNRKRGETMWRYILVIPPREAH